MICPCDGVQSPFTEVTVPANTKPERSTSWRKSIGITVAGKARLGRYTRINSASVVAKRGEGDGAITTPGSQERHRSLCCPLAAAEPRWRECRKGRGASA